MYVENWRHITQVSIGLIYYIFKTNLSFFSSNWHLMLLCTWLRVLLLSSPSSSCENWSRFWSMSARLISDGWFTMTSNFFFVKSGRKTILQNLFYFSWVMTIDEAQISGADKSFFSDTIFFGSEQQTYFNLFWKKQLSFWKTRLGKTYLYIC